VDETGSPDRMRTADTYSSLLTRGCAIYETWHSDSVSASASGGAASPLLLTPGPSVETGGTDSGSKPDLGDIN